MRRPQRSKPWPKARIIFIAWIANSAAVIPAKRPNCPFWHRIGIGGLFPSECPALVRAACYQLAVSTLPPFAHSRLISRHPPESVKYQSLDGRPRRNFAENKAAADNRVGVTLQRTRIIRYIAIDHLASLKTPWSSRSIPRQRR
jgi:hypothetical protein